jgi:hypothetical protein
MLARIFLFLIYTATGITLIMIPWGVVYGEATNFLMVMEPSEPNNGFDPLFTFCLFAPALLMLESTFLKLPLRRWSLLFMILQLIGVIWTWPIIVLTPIGIISRHDETYWAVALIADMFATYSLVLHFFVLFPKACEWKWATIHIQKAKS